MSPRQTGFILLFCIIFVISQGIFADVSGESGNDSEHGNSSANPAVTIIQPAEILTAGTYLLKNSTGNMTSAIGVVIRTDNVILDGMGQTLEGNGSSPSAGIRIHNPDHLIQNISIINVTISGFESGIWVENVKNVTIYGCTVRKNAKSGLVIANVSECLVADSEISANKPPLDSSGGTGIEVTNSDGIEIRNVRVLSNGRGQEGDGIRISDSSGVSIGSSTISSNAKNGILAIRISSGLVIRDNSICSNGENGLILMTSDGPVIANNRIEHNLVSALDISGCQRGMLAGNNGDYGRVGISLSECEEFRMSTNLFRGNEINFDITGSSPAMYNHVIDTSNKADGRPIRYLRNIHDVIINSSDNPSCVYAVNSSGIHVTDLVFNKNGAGIFLINTSDVSISRVAMLDNGCGIRVGYGSSDVRISDCSAENNLVAGFAVSSSDNISFESCFSQKNLAGFLFTGSTAISCFDCHAEKQQGLKKRGPSGFQISDCQNVTITNSSAELNPFDGIYLRDSPGTKILATNLLSNEVAGIASLSDNLSLTESTIKNNKVAGILIYGNGSILTGNRVTENSGRGLLVDVTSDGKIWNNIFNNSKNTELPGIRTHTFWNVSPGDGNAISGGTQIGGNYWGSPKGGGFSDTCGPDADGFCSSPFPVGTGEFDLHPLTSPKTASFSLNNTTRIESYSVSGDLNANGRRDLQDVVLLVDLISENRAGSVYDFSGDGRINLQDAVVLFSLLSG